MPDDRYEITISSPDDPPVNPAPVKYRPTDVDKTIGQVAYEKWAELVPVSLPLPGWNKLPESAHAGWEEVALAAVNQHIDQRDWK